MTRRRLVFLGILTALVFVGLVAYGDSREVASRLVNFPLPLLLAALSLAALNFLLRFLRWSYYLRVLRIRVPWGVSGLIFLAGLSLSITPGKVGELLKSYLLRDRVGVPVPASVPVVVMERVTDVVSVVLLGLVGVLLLPPLVAYGLLAVLLVCALGTLVLTSRHSDGLLRLPFIRRWQAELRTSREGLRQLTGPRPLLVAILLGGLAWLSEGVALWVILQGLDAPVDLRWALPIYAAATLVGAASALPGGLLGTEGSMVALLQQTGIDRGAASTGTLLVRLVTLWFAVLVGMVALACLHRVRRVRLVNDTAEAGGQQDSTVRPTPP
jgi:uncharacterized protein (TIRG00374 family)